MAEAENGRTLHKQVREVAIDVRNEGITRTANLYLLTRKILLASLGALALTADEAGEFMDRLVDRGEVAEADIQNLLADLRSQGMGSDIDLGKTRQETIKRAGSALDESVESILVRLNVPTKTDIENLSKKIHLLNEKVIELKEREVEET